MILELFSCAAWEDNACVHASMCCVKSKLCLAIAHVRSLAVAATNSCT